MSSLEQFAAGSQAWLYRIQFCKRDSLSTKSPMWLTFADFENKKEAHNKLVDLRADYSTEYRLIAINFFVIE